MATSDHDTPLVIGRESPADIVIAAPQVSARHASIIRLDQQTFLIKDLGSLNGTFVNGERVETTVIRPPDDVRLGTVRLTWDVLLSRVPVPTDEKRAPAAVDAAPAQRGHAVSPRGQGPPTPVADQRQEAPKEPAVPAAAPAPQLQPKAAPAAGTPLSQDLAAALSAQKTYGSKAFFVWFLYWLLWLPGFVMNLVYLSEANGIKKQTGVSPSGRGCLVLLLIVHVVLPIAAIVLLLAVGGGVLHGILN